MRMRLTLRRHIVPIADRGILRRYHTSHPPTPVAAEPLKRAETATWAATLAPS